MSIARLVLPLLLCLAALPVAAATPVRVQPGDLHLDHLRPGTATYVVYMHAGPGSAIQRAMLATSSLGREKVDGQDAWVIEQAWQDETGTLHTARTVHAARDLATLAQDSTWTTPKGSFTTRIDPPKGSGRIEGEIPADRRARMEAGFPGMRDGWWLNWHSDLALLPLLPWERGGTLRLRVFDAGMPAPIDVDYTVVGERRLQGADGTTYTCWLVETESGSPGGGNYQRFWIDQARRIVLKEEDTFNGKYRAKVLLSVPATTEFPATAPAGTPPPK